MNVTAIHFISNIWGIRCWQIDIDGLVQNCRNSIVNAMESLKFCTKISTCTIHSIEYEDAFGVLFMWLYYQLIWWRHQMETCSVSLAICAGNSPVTGEFPARRPVTRSFDAFFDLRLNKRLSKQSWCGWFESLSRPLWRHCDGVDQCDINDCKTAVTTVR